MKIKYALTLILAAALTAAGCNKTTGNGWIPVFDKNNKETGKASFTYQMKCNNQFLNVWEKVGMISGQFQYEDQITVLDKYPVKFIALGESLLENFPNRGRIFCEQVDGIYYSHDFNFTGFYTPQPQNMFREIDKGVFQLVVHVEDKPGLYRFDLKLNKGIFDGYKVQGILNEKNLQVVEEKNSDSP